MELAQAFVCAAFLKKTDPQHQQSLMLYLPQEEQALLQSLPSTYQDVIHSYPSWEEDLRFIHYSWITPFLRTLAENEIRLFLSALPEELVAGLKKQLLFSNHLLSLSTPAKFFLQKTLIKNLKKNILPLAYLPQDPLNILLEFTYPQLKQFIELLAMHDLSIEIKQIIDTILLKHIYAALSKKQQTYLKTLSSQKEAVTFRRMALNRWDGNRESLERLLSHRGLNRIAKAFYGKNDHLIWYFTHRIDSELAASFNKLCSDINNRDAQKILAEQIVQLAQTLKTHPINKFL